MVILWKNKVFKYKESKASSSGKVINKAFSLENNHKPQMITKIILNNNKKHKTNKLLIFRKYTIKFP